VHQALGEQLARTIAAKDRDGLLAVFAPAIDFRAMTPSRIWEASSPQAVADIVFGTWLGEREHIDALEEVHVGEVVDRDRVSYLLRVSTPGGTYLVEQQAYFDVEEDRISWLRIMCSGFRRVDRGAGGGST
jgi:hypothetical protein